MVRAWSEWEVAFLTENYSSLTTRSISEKLGRSISSIRSKAFKLGLCKSESSISETMATRYDAALSVFNKLAVEEVPIEKAFKHKKWLEQHYYDQELSLSDIAALTRSTRKNIEYWMRKFELPRRNASERYTERCLSKISETSKGREPFSKGLTKYTHPSILSTSLKISGKKNHLDGEAEGIQLRLGTLW